MFPKERTRPPEPFFVPRQGTIGDAEAMGRIAYGTVDIEPDRATEEVKAVLNAPFVPSTVVESLLGEGRQIVAVINGALLRPWFSKRLLDGDEPHFHNCVRNAEVSPFPTLEEIGVANAGEGLDMFLAHVAVNGDLEDADAIRVRTALLGSFVDHFSGNRLRSLLVETAGWENTTTAMSAGFEVVSTYPRWRAANGVLEREGPHLLQITLEGAMQVQNFHSVRMLQYREPRIRFPQGAQELLRLAVRGLPDAEVAALPGFTETSVASAWTRILAKARVTVPDLFAATRPSGKSKDRLTLLAYLRQYPEELWPYG